MKYLLFLCMPLLLLAQVHYAKLEPYDRVLLKSAVSALVMDVNLEAEAKLIKNERVIYLDDSLDKVNLSSSKKSMKILKEMLKINQDIAKALAETLKRQESYYKRINKLSTASKTQKDTAYSAFTSAKTQHLNTKEKILSLEKQILDLRYKIAGLEDSIAKKSIILKNKYLYKLTVRKGDFVTMGSPLAEIMDISKAKLTLFLDSEELLDLEHKKIYLNDKKTELKISKIWKIADDKYISSYRAEIILPMPKDEFSKLVKIEIK